MARLVFLGTPDAAVPTLELLHREHDVALVVTQPDRPRGRSKRPQAPPVKSAALNLGLKIAQPRSHEELRDNLDAVGDLQLGVVVAYGRLLRPSVLEIPDRGYLNVHFSLLPRWRGAAPVARALMAGDDMTGVTIIRLNEGLDTGPVLTAQAVDVGEAENAGELTARLAKVGARLIAGVLPGYVDGSVSPIAQTDEGVTFADKISREDRPLDVDGDPQTFVDKVRALAPDPGATLEIDGEKVKVLEAATHPVTPGRGEWADLDGALVGGVDGGGVAIVTIQPPGKTPMSGADWLRGRRSDRGQIG